jgi:hypothetical protein
MRTAWRWAGWAGAALLLSTAVQAAGPRRIDYLSIEANEGGSSGGHAAIRFGDAVFHFQHHVPGVLRLHRDDAGGFFFTYNLLQNRGIAVSHIAVSDDTYTLLHDWFNRRYLTEAMEFDTLDARHDDRALIEALLRRMRSTGSVADGDATNGIALRGAGYFFRDGSDRGGATESAPLVALQHKVRDLYGTDLIQRRSTELRIALAHLTPTDDDSSFSRRYADLMSGLLALEALQRALPLQSGTFHAPSSDAFVLRDGERAALAEFAAHLEDDLLHLLRSPRPDWGFPLLVGMARLTALRQSVRTGRLVFLDAFSEHARVVPSAAWRDRLPMMVDLLDEARADLDTARSRLSAGAALGEADLTRLESAANRFSELLRGITEDRDVRVQSGPLVPARAARRTDLILPMLSTVDLEADLTVARDRERNYEQELRERYTYDLITRNCVSEIFSGIDTALLAAASERAGAGDERPQSERLRAESRRRLGGYIEPGAAFSFIPFVSTQAVREAYDVTGTQQVPSYRDRRLTAMYRHESPLLVFLRESNTLTSTIYEPNPRDSFFVFFTDALPTRPLLGGINLAADLGATAVGLALAPLDGGQIFLSGLKGALFSLPELAFVNLRKGTYDYVERTYWPGTLVRPAR